MGLLDFFVKKPVVIPAIIAPTLEEIDSKMVERAKTILESKGFDINGASPELRRIATEMREWRALHHGGGDGYSEYHVAAAFAAIYTRLSDTRRKMIKDVDKMRNFYLVDTLITTLVDDALTPEVGTGHIVRITSNEKEIQKEIDFLDRKFKFDSIISSIAADLISYGEYTLSTRVNPIPENLKDRVELSGTMTEEPISTKTDEYGLIDLRDDIEQGSVVPISEYDRVNFYIVLDKTGRLHRHEPADYVKFSLGNQKMRVDLIKEFNIDLSRLPDDVDLPRYARVGKSAIYPVLSKLKELELLEAMVPASKLSKLSQGSLIGVQVPAAYDIQQGLEASQKIEGLLNKKVGVDSSRGELTIESIMLSAGRFKCIPIFGDKGVLSKLDYKADEPDELLTSVNEIRKVICDSMGVPYEILYGSDSTSRSDILKKYSRYLRKLKSIQQGVKEGIYQIIYIHLSNKGIVYSPENIKVEFTNKLIEIDNLDRLEFIDTTVQLLQNLKNFVLELADPNTSPIHDRINIGELVTFLNHQLSVVGFNNLIDVDGDGTAEGEFEGDPMDLTGNLDPEVQVATDGVKQRVEKPRPSPSSSSSKPLPTRLPDNNPVADDELDTGDLDDLE